MLGKHIIGYLPALIVPAASSFAAIFCYTRLLSPGQYGYYALSISIMNLLNALFFYWLQTALPRLLPQAIKEGKAMQLRITAYLAYGAVSMLLVMCMFLFLGIVDIKDLKLVAWLAVPLALARSLLNLNQAFHRSNLDFKRYNIIECGQALLGLMLGLTLVMVLHWNSTGAIVGMACAMVCMLAVDIRALLQVSLKRFSKPALTEIARFGLPLVFTYGFAFVIASSDRFMIEHFQGVGQVGIYAAGYSLMDRIAQIVFMMVATPSFPLTIHKLEHEGVAAAQRQTYDNGVALLALAMPACAGLILCNSQLAAILIGSDFRAGAMQVMPWIAMASFLNGFSTHYFDHAFYLAKKPYMLLFTQGPAAAFNLILNLILIPRYGYMGAAYSTVASYTLLLTLSTLVGRQVFHIRFPFVVALQVGLATGCMALALAVVHFPDTVFGLAAMVVLGGSVYTIVILAFNVMNARIVLGKIIRKLI
jgi:O-antigen/teichoic acid export membrane protein